jgi:hypothetical protein
MNKSKLNFIIDATMFLTMMAMAGLGLLMKYIMPPGRVLREKYGSNPELTWLGWDRHDWGDIHFYLALTFLTLLVLHIILHWSQILGLFHRLVPNPRGRSRIAIIFVLLSLLLIWWPFMITPDRQERGRGGGGGRHRSQVGGSEIRVAVMVPPGVGGGALREPAGAIRCSTPWAAGPKNSNTFTESG